MISGKQINRRGIAGALVDSQPAWSVRELWERMVEPGLMSIHTLFQLVEDACELDDAGWLTVHSRWILWLKQNRDRQRRRKPNYALNHAARLASKYLDGHAVDIQELRDSIGEIWINRTMQKDSNVRRELMPLIIQYVESKH